MVRKAFVDVLVGWRFTVLCYFIVVFANDRRDNCVRASLHVRLYLGVFSGLEIIKINILTLLSFF